MPYAIMRCVKLKGMGAVAASLQHCFRERETLNADPKRTPTNLHFSATTTDEAMGKLRELLPLKRRKDAVLVVEYVMTASPEWWETAQEVQKIDFVTKSTEWLTSKYGAENVITMSVHQDELTPHISAYVVPKTQDGRLSAKDFIGNKTQMSKDQSSFAAAVAHLGLRRGLEGSKATHQRVKLHYSALQASDKVEMQPLTMSDVGYADVSKKPSERLLSYIGFPTLETPERHLERLNDKIAANMSVIKENAATLHLERLTHDKIRNNQRWLLAERKRLGLDKLPQHQQNLVQAFVRDILKNNEIEKSLELERKRNRGRGR